MCSIHVTCATIKSFLWDLPADLNFILSFWPVKSSRSYHLLISRNQSTSTKLFSMWILSETKNISFRHSKKKTKEKNRSLRHDSWLIKMNSNFFLSRWFRNSRNILFRSFAQFTKVFTTFLVVWSRNEIFDATMTWELQRQWMESIAIERKRAGEDEWKKKQKNTVKTHSRDTSKRENSILAVYIHELSTRSSCSIWFLVCRNEETKKWRDSCKWKNGVT